LAGTLVGYARTSTSDQKAGLQAQLEQLRHAGCTKIFSEHGSGVDAARPEFMKALDYLREDDVLVVTKPCRFARSAPDLLKKVDELKGRGITLRILSMGLDTSDLSPTGKLMLTVLAAVAEFERGIMLERQLDGIARAKAEGKYKGRSPTARARSAEVMALRCDGLNPAEIARRVGIGRASVYRIIQGQEIAAPSG